MDDDGVEKETLTEHPAVVAQRDELGQHVHHLAPGLRETQQ